MDRRKALISTRRDVCLVIIISFERLDSIIHQARLSHVFVTCILCDPCKRHMFVLDRVISADARIWSASRAERHSRLYVSYRKHATHNVRRSRRGRALQREHLASLRQSS